MENAISSQAGYAEIYDSMLFCERLKDDLIWALIGGLITRGILRPRRYFSRLELTHLHRIRSFLLFHAIAGPNELAQGSAHRLNAPQAGKEFLAAAL